MDIESFKPSIPVNKEEQINTIEFILKASENKNGNLKRRIISAVTERQKDDLLKHGVIIYKDWVHSIETSAVIHARKRHGNPKSERNKGQIALVDQDFLLIPEILENYDRLYKTETTSRSTRNEIIKYEKKYDDGTIYYIEEKRDGRKSLAFQTMYKKV